jgi:HlyD family secretion protein
VLSVMDDRQLWIRAYVPQNQVGLQVGQQLRVMVDSFPQEQFVGEVTFISRQAEFTPGNVQTPEERSKQVFRIKVALQDEKARLRPGMTADVWLNPLSESP